MVSQNMFLYRTPLSCNDVRYKMPVLRSEENNRGIEITALGCCLTFRRKIICLWITVDHWWLKPWKAKLQIGGLPHARRNSVKSISLC